MPRRLPRLNLHFIKQVDEALQLTSRLEQGFLLSDNSGNKVLRLQDLEYGYEISYLRVFVAWEVFLESTLFRLLCGYAHSGGQEPLRTGQNYFPTLSVAEQALLNGRNYLLWHNPSYAIARANSKLTNSRYEAVLSSALSQIEHFANIRHRITHAQEDAKNNFDLATMAICAQRFRGSRPGRFLRKFDSTATTPTRFLEALSRDLGSLANQICA